MTPKHTADKKTRTHTSDAGEDLFRLFTGLDDSTGLIRDRTS